MSAVAFIFVTITVATLSLQVDTSSDSGPKSQIKFLLVLHKWLRLEDNINYYLLLLHCLYTMQCSSAELSHCNNAILILTILFLIW